MIVTCISTAVTRWLGLEGGSMISLTKSLLYPGFHGAYNVAGRSPKHHWCSIRVEYYEIVRTSALDGLCLEEAVRHLLNLKVTTRFADNV
jgi:hypothetical protein